MVLNNGPGPELMASRRREGPNHQPVVTASPAGPAPPGNVVQQVSGFQPAGGPPVPPPQNPQGPVPPVGAMQPALYQTPVPQAGLMPPPVPPPQPFPGASRR